MNFIWTDLLNSNFHDYLGKGRSEDRLDNPVWLRSFLAPWKLKLNKLQLNEFHSALAELRSLIQRMVETTVSGKIIPKKDWDVLNSFITAVPMIRRLEILDNEYKLKLTSMVNNRESLLADIAISFAEVFVNGDPNRIKLCANSDCRWVFYDKSKNQTRKWCESSFCGNLIKVRRFRARKKKETTSKI